MKILIRNRELEKWTIAEPKNVETEEELQELLVNSPQIIPLSDIEDRSSLLATIREFAIGAGSADILAFGSDGDIAIIECKRAENPDVKRKVIGQILEYASYLWGRSYEEIDEYVHRKLRGKSLVELVKEKAEENWDEENFRNGVKNSLENGRFILIIAVDRINEELKRIILYLNKCWRPGYSVYALEMHRFKTGDSQILIPHLYPESKVGEKPSEPWSWEKFRRIIEEQLQKEVVEVIVELHDWSTSEEMKRLGGGVEFGKGEKYGSMHFYLKDIPASIFTIWTGGYLALNYGGFVKYVGEEIVRDFHKEHSLNVREDFSKFPSIKVADAFVDRPEAVEKFKGAIIWLAKKVHSLPTTTEASSLEL